MAARLFALAAAYAAGVVLSEHIGAWVWIPIVVGSLIAFWRKRAIAGLLALFFALGSLLAGLRLMASEHAALARGAERGADALIDGTIATDPETLNGSMRFVLAARAAEIDGVSLRLRERVVVTMRPPRNLRFGAIIRIDARLRSLFFRGMDASARASALRLLHGGVVARALLVGDLTIEGKDTGILARIAERGRRAVEQAASHVPRGEQGLLLGVTIGDTSLLDPGIARDFRTTGLSHIVAVSGANVAFVLALVAFVLRLARAGRGTTVAVMALSLVSFMAMARFEPSVMRAGVMAGIGLLGIAIGARRAASIALGAASLGLLIADPFLVYAPGFQLSVLATAGILFIAPKIAHALPEGKLTDVAAVTIGAQLAVAPLIVLEFHQLSLISLAANILVAPMVAPATILGMVAAIAGFVSAPLASIAVLARAPIIWMQWIAHVLAGLPLASLTMPSGIAGAGIAIVLGVCAVLVARGHRPRRLASVAIALMMLAAGGVWARALEPPPLHGLVITMLNVGQGDAFIVQQGSHTMLIDGGPDPQTLLAGLANHGVHRADLLVMTHPHADHVDGFVPIAQTFPIARALDAYIASDLPAYRGIVSALHERGIPRDRARTGMHYRLGDAEVDVLWPPPVLMTDTGADVNNNSIVLRARYGTQTVLFAGETQEEAQRALLDSGQSLRADVLKVSHHGSRHMLPEFYAATGARIALIPVGPNTFGHPSPATLMALHDMKILRSDRNGEVQVAVEDPGETVRAQRETAA